MTHARIACLTLVASLSLGACGTTGQPIVSFTGQAGAVAGVTPGQPFTTGSGYTVTLDTATLHLGAIYLNQYNALSGAGSEPCVLDGIYVAELFGPVDLDLLSPAMTAFPQPGSGTETLARTAQLWLLEGDIDDPDSTQQVLQLAGTALRGVTAWPFTATVTIGENRLPEVVDVSAPGANPICQERIVTPIEPVGGEITPSDAGVLSLRVDVRHMLDAVDFDLLGTGVPQASAASATPYVIPDEINVVSDQLFGGLRSDANVYAVSFEVAP